MMIGSALYHPSDSDGPTPTPDSDDSSAAEFQEIESMLAELEATSDEPKLTGPSPSADNNSPATSLMIPALNDAPAIVDSAAKDSASTNHTGSVPVQDVSYTGTHSRTNPGTPATTQTRSGPRIRFTGTIDPI
ncbi:MAG: hypothetical protein R3C59_14745 [Planctomycetaceae bacterium]